jgi:hypothetical protein
MFSSTCASFQSANLRRVLLLLRLLLLLLLLPPSALSYSVLHLSSHRFFPFFLFVSALLAATTAVFCQEPRSNRIQHQTVQPSATRTLRTHSSESFNNVVGDSFAHKMSALDQ